MAVITVKASVKCPIVPNFVQLENKSWMPLCALSDEGLVELSKAWLEACRERVKEQSKDKELFYKTAHKGEA